MSQTVSIFQGAEIDRTYANDPDEPIVYVTLPDGHEERFWMTNLTDKEYKFRAEMCRNLDRNSRKK